MHLSIVALNNYTGSKATKSLKKDSKSFDICIAAKISLIAHNNNKNTFKLQTIKIISIKDHHHTNNKATKILKHNSHS